MYVVHVDEVYVAYILLAGNETGDELREGSEDSGE